jgi:hypothetical protein
MLELAFESYGPLPTLQHSAEPLAYQSGSVETVADEAETRGWLAMSAMELGMAPADYNEQTNLDYSFVNGLYQAEDASPSAAESLIDALPVIGISGDRSQADALVLEGDVDGQRTLAVVFRGTDQIVDWADYLNFDTYYQLFAPLVTQIVDYLNDSDNEITQVLVSGHSLGAAAVQYFLQSLSQAGVTQTIQAYTDGSPGAETNTLGNGSEVENFLNTNDLVTKVPVYLDAPKIIVPLIEDAVSDIPGANLIAAGLSALVSAAQPKQREGSSINLDTDIASLPGVAEHNSAFYEQESEILTDFADDLESPFKGSQLAQSLTSDQVYQGPPIGIALAGVGGPETAVPAYVPGTTQLTTAALPETYTVHIQTGDTYALGNEVGLDSDLPDEFIWNLPSTSDVHIVDGGPSENATVLMPLFSSWYTEASATTVYGAETVVSLALPSAFSALNGVVGDLYRVSKIVFTGTNPFSYLYNLGMPSGPQEYVINTDGAATTVQQASPGQTALTVDSSYDYTNTGAANLTVTGSGDGDVIAIGTGNVTVDETTGDNTIFVEDAATAGNITVQTGSGDNTVITGAGNDVLTGGLGADSFEPGGGTNFVDGGGGQATLVLTANEDEYSFASAVQSDGTVGALITHVGPTGSDGVDTVVDVQTIQFADATCSLETGTTGNDTFTDSATDTIVIGGGGSDTFSATDLSSEQAQISVNSQGNVVIIEPSSFDVLVGLSTITLADATIAIAGNVLTQQNADGSSMVSTFNITGQVYTSDVLSYGAEGQLQSALYDGVTGYGNLSSFEYIYAGGNLIGADDFYTGITGQAYTGEEADYNGAGQLTGAAFTGVTGAAYSAYQYNYVGGVLSGSEFTFTTVPTGATYSSYDVDFDQAGNFTGDQFFFTNIQGQFYTSEEVNIDASGALSSVLLTGITDQAYSSLQLDYSAGTYEGYQAFLTGIKGQAYTSEEVDVSAAGQLEKVIYSGMTSTPYSSDEVDYSGGAVSDVIYNYANVTGQPYYADQVEVTPGGAGLQETQDLNSGGHDLIAMASGQTLTSLGDDTMTGSATGATTFVFNAIYGADTIANFTSADAISLPSSEFANFAAMDTTSNVANVAGNVVITAADGDTLTIDGLNTTALAGLSANFTFHS